MDGLCMQTIAELRRMEAGTSGHINIKNKLTVYGIVLVNSMGL